MDDPAVPAVRDPSGGRRWRATRLPPRITLAIGLSAGLSYAVWRLVPRRLSVVTDIVGYPIFADYDFRRYFDAFYLVGIVFPLVAVVLCFLLPMGRAARRPSGRTPIRPLSLREPSPLSDGADDRGEDGPELRTVTVTRRWGRILLPAFAVGACVGIASSGHGPVLGSWGIAAAALYGLNVVALTRLLSRKTSGPDGAALSAAVNGGAALVVLPLLYLVSRSTAVVVTSGHVVHRYPWLPLWLILPVTGGVVLWYRRRLRGASSIAAQGDAEAAVLTYVVGPALLLVLIARLAGALDTPFYGFDQAQSFTTAHLSFGHGLFPWRDLYVIHGVFADILSGQLGMSVFGASRWGSTAGFTMFLIPMLWISLYMFTAYFARRNRLVAVGFVAVAVLWLTSGRLAGVGLAFGHDVQAFSSGYFRFAFLPLVLVLFDQTIRRRSRGWCAGFMAVVVAQAIAVPETGLMAVGILATLAVFEFLGRGPGAGWVGPLMRTRWCAGLGALFVGAWVVFLAATGALRGFVDYYLIFGPGHALSGAVPAGWIGQELGPTVELVVPVVLIVLTLVRVAAMIHLRRPWTSRDWVMVGAATFVVVFYQKVLARADEVHVAEVFTVTLPLLVLWVVTGAEALDDAMAGAASRRARRRSAHGRSTTMRRLALGVRHPGTLATVVALVALAPAPVGTVKAVAGDFHVDVRSEPDLTRLGYAAPGVIDETMVRDLEIVLRRYAGPTGPVFDFNDEPGLLYYLLDRVPGTRFFHVSMADTGFAQRQLISELKRSRPRVVVFYGQGIGLPSWDGIEATVRHYDVSDYVLDHYRPLADVDGQLLMIRADLAASAPPLPRVVGTATTQDLYLTNPECDWGFAPNFLRRPASLGSQPGITVGTRVISTSTLLIGGWSFDPRRGQPPHRVLAVRNGHVVATVVPNVPRLDVTEYFHRRAALRSGYTLALPTTPDAVPLALYALNADDTVSPLGRGANVPGSLVGPVPAPALTTPDGHRHAVSRETGGVVEAAFVGNQKVVALDVPSGTNLARYHWLELSSASGLRLAQYSMVDGRDQSPSAIGFRTLPRAGAHVFVQVGSCPQWRGFAPSGLALVQEGGPASAPVVRLVR